MLQPPLWQEIDLEHLWCITFVIVVASLEGFVLQIRKKRRARSLMARHRLPCDRRLHIHTQRGPVWGVWFSRPVKTAFVKQQHSSRLALVSQSSHTSSLHPTPTPHTHTHTHPSCSHTHGPVPCQSTAVYGTERSPNCWRHTLLFCSSEASSP